MDKSSLLLGIDVGTGSVKAALFDTAGRMIGFGQHEYSFDHPMPMWSELPPETVWNQMGHAVRDCICSGNASPNLIAGIGFSCIGDTGMALDALGDPVYPAIESTDQRDGAYREYVQLLEQKVGSEWIYNHTGYPLSSLPPIHKILWLKDNRPDVYEKMARYATFQEFLVRKLTGVSCVDYSLASRTMAFDLTQKNWLHSMLEKVAIPETLFSQALPSSRIAGYLLPERASEWGLPVGLPVVPGAHDQCCNAMGMGILDTKMVGDGVGSVEALVRITSKPQVSNRFKELGIGCQCHSLENSYLSIAFHLTAGSLVRWYRDQFGQPEMDAAVRTGRSAYDLLTEGAEKAPPGANGLLLLPHFLGSGTCRKPPLNAASRGTLLGLSLAHTKNDITRAMFEGVSYEMKYLLDGLAASGDDIEVIVAAGGTAKSDFCMQLKADMTGKPVVVPDITETSCLGAALLAGLGTGVYSSFADASAKACHFKKEYKPDPARHAVYQENYQIYRDLYESVIEINTRLTGLGG